MPIYRFRHNKCNKVTEVFRQSINDRDKPYGCGHCKEMVDPLEEDENGNKVAHRIPQLGHFQFVDGMPSYQLGEGDFGSYDEEFQA